MATNSAKKPFPAIRLVGSMTRVTSVRLPKAWEGHVTAAQARQWIIAWIAEPRTLTEVPAGDCKLNLRLSDLEIATLKRAAGQSVSSTIRGVLALHMLQKPLEQKSRWKLLVGSAVAGIALCLLFAAGVGPRRS